MARTTVNVDRELVDEVRRALKTSGLSDTVNAALSQVARQARLATFSVHDFDITDEDLARMRRDRTLD